MNKSDLDFRKNCQTWHKKIRSFIKKGEFNKASELKMQIESSLKKWEEHERSVRFRKHMLKSLISVIIKEERSKPRK